MNDLADNAGGYADLAAGLSAAEDARRRGDLEGALHLWASLRQRHPGALAPVLRPVLALRDAGQRAAADPLAAMATQCFPAELEPIWVYALLAQERGEREEAVRRFGLLLQRFPGHRDSLMRIIGLLRDLGRFSDTEERLIEAMQYCPDEPWFSAQYGWTALVRRDIGAAAARFNACRESFPDYPDATLGAAVTLRESGYMQEADDLLAAGIVRFPHDAALAFGHADHGLWMRTAGFLTWDQALQRWETLRAAFTDFRRGYVEGIRVLVEAGRRDAAEALAAQAVERFPGDSQLAAEFARRAEDRQDWPELVHRFGRMVDAFPDQPAAHAGLGRALSLVGSDAEAESLLAAAMERFPCDPDPAIEYAMIANRRGDWSEAMLRWTAAQRRFPEHRTISHRLGEAQLRLVDLEGAAMQQREDAGAPASVATKAVTNAANLDRDAMHQMMMCFESLGGDSERGGCEFGLFQRQYGAEPLGLLRWSTMRHFEIIPALEAEFDGVGLPENTELVLGPPEDDPEYFTVDKRFGMRMHTFVRRAEVKHDAMYKQVCRRLIFLKDKLLADLHAANKIFVYSSYPNDLDEAQIEQLFRAIRRYGDTTLLYVRSASEAHPEGSVIESTPGLLIGHIDSPSKFGRSAVGAQPWPAWAKICPRAFMLWQVRLGAMVAT